MVSWLRLKIITTADIDFTCKYARLGGVYSRASQPLRDLLDSSPANLEMRVLVDIKVQDLRVGQYTCIPGWHRDSISDPDAVHHLIVFGENTTEFEGFMGEPYSIPRGKWFSYTNDLHRGPRVRVDETRILVRLTETDVIKGNSRLTPI